MELRCECGHLYPAHNDETGCIDGCDCKLDRIAVLLHCLRVAEQKIQARLFYDFVLLLMVILFIIYGG